MLSIRAMIHDSSQLRVQILPKRTRAKKLQLQQKLSQRTSESSEGRVLVAISFASAICLCCCSLLRAFDTGPRVESEPAHFAMDSDETQPVDISTCKSPPPSTKRKPSPEVSASEMRADYKRTREARIRTEPRLPYNPYTPEPSHPKARSSAEAFTPDDQVQSIHSLTL